MNKKNIWQFLINIAILLVLFSPVQAQAQESLAKLLREIYNKMLSIYADSIYEFDSQIAKTITNNEQLVSANTDQAVKSAIDAEVTSSLEAPSTSEVPFVIGETNDNTNQNSENNGETQKSNPLNAATLFLPDTYNEKEQQDALAYIKQLKGSSSLSSTIYLSNHFVIPIMNLNDPNQNIVVVTLSNKERTKLAAALKSDAQYRTYASNYYSLAAIRNAFLTNLQGSYEARVKHDGKSLAQLEDEQAKERLSSEYLGKISTASPAVVNREMLVVLSEIRNELHEIKKQNERLLITTSVSNLASLASSSRSLDVEVKQLGSHIYCDILPEEGIKKKDEAICGSTETTTNEETEAKTSEGEQTFTDALGKF